MAGLIVKAVMLLRTKRERKDNLADTVKEKEVYTQAEIKRVEDYLKSYRINGKLLRLERYEREYFKDNGCCDYEALGEAPLARARMYEVRHFINSLENCDEKLFLYYHYVKV